MANPFAPLAAALHGELHTELAQRTLYASDASPYEALPDAVARPRDRHDLAALLAFAQTHDACLIPRGAGTSLAGQCVATPTAGDRPRIVIDNYRHLNRILNIDPYKREATVQTGVVIAELNRAAAAFGLMFAPDPSTLNRATVGGAFANNAWGSHVLRHGDCRDNVQRVAGLLADGQPFSFGDHDPPTELHARLSAAIAPHQPTLAAAVPSGVICNAGYALHTLWPTGNPNATPPNLKNLLAGSEGALALIESLTVRLTPLRGATAMLAAHFDTAQAAHQAVAPLLAHDPCALELLDAPILTLARQQPAQRRHCQWLIGQPAALLLIEFDGADAAARAAQARQHLSALSCSAAPLLSPQAAAHALTLRRAGLGLLMSLRTGPTGSRRAVTGLEDAAVPPHNLAAFTRDLSAAIAAADTQATLYGSVGAGLVHTRPFLDLNDPNDQARYTRLLDATAALAQRYGGCLSAKHGDGRLRARYLAQTLGAEFAAHCRTVKQHFDPHNRLNPDKIATAPEPLSALRRPVANPAAQTCHGVGACLQTTDAGIMCPSYQATREERYAPRGRAALLRRWHQGERRRALRRAITDSLAHCLGCKACQRECPASVDIAAEKQRWQAESGIGPLDLSQTLRLAAQAPGLVNALLRTTLARRWLGLDPTRRPPALAQRRFSRLAATSAPNPTLVLVNEPYTEFFEPDVGLAALRVLRALGHRISIATPLSDVRSALAAGRFNTAKTRAQRTLDAAGPDATLIFLEPAEWSAYIDDLKDHLSEPQRRRCVLFDSFIARTPLNLPDPLPPLRLHPHCHQYALGAADDLQTLFRGHGQPLPQGCCGMAGDFGLRRRTATLSERIGAALLNRSPAPQAPILATGFSCRSQWRRLSPAPVMHPAQWLAAHALNQNARSQTNRGNY